MITIPEANQLREKTQDAYSYDRYGPTAWRKAIQLLTECQYSIGEIEWILRSKYMRWAADRFCQFDEVNEDEVLDGCEIIKYRDYDGGINLSEYYEELENAQ